MKAKQTKEALLRQVARLEKTVKKLRTSDALYHELFNNMPSSCAVYEAENGGENFIIRDFNTAGEAVEKISRQDVIGKRVTDVFPGVTDFGLRDVLKRVWQTGVSERFPVALYRDRRIEGWRDNYVYRRSDGNVAALYSDETERMQAEEDRWMSEERYRFITENMNDIVWSINLDLRTTYASPSIERVLGFTPGERLLMSIDEMLTPESVRKVGERFREELQMEQEGINPGRSITMECEFYRKDGSTLWMESTVLIMRDPSGAANGLWGVSRDISERKTAEAELRESEERYRTLYNNSQIGLFRFSMSDGHIITCNDRFVELMGHATQEECLSHYATRGGYFHPGDLIVLMNELLSKRTLSGYEVRLNKPGERESWASFTGKVFPEKDYIEGAIIDITEHKLAVERLRRSEERSSMMLMTAMDGLLVFDSKGDILLVNEAMSVITGFSLEELSRMNMDELLFDSMGNRINEMFELIKKGPQRYETLIRDRGGDLRDIEFSASYMARQDCVFGFVRDMTAQKKAESALSESEEKYRRLVEEINDIVISIDAKGIITYISPVAWEISGYTYEEMNGRSISDFIHPDDVNVLHENIRKRSEGIMGTGNDYRLIMKSGEIRWFRVSSTPLFADNAFIGVHGIMTDITERKKAEIALEDSERRLNNIMQGSPIPTFVIDRDHRVILWNKALEEYSSLTARDIVGTSDHWKAFYSEQRPCLADVIIDSGDEGVHRYYKGKLSKSPILDNAWAVIDYFPLMHGGTWFMFTAAPLCDSSGKFIGAIETLQDITERKIAEEALKASELKYWTVANFTYDWVYWVSNRGDYVYVSPSCERITGYKAEEFILYPDLLANIIHPDDRKIYNDHIQIDFRENRVCELNFRIIRKDGAIRHISHNCLPVVDADGVFRGRRGSNRDMTEQHLAEMKIRDGEAIARALIDTPGDPVLIIDTADIILDCNSAFQKQMMKPWSDIVGFELRSILDENRCIIWESMLETVKKSAIPTHFDESMGSYWFDTSIYPVRDADGTIGRFVIESRDVSEMMQMQKHIIHVSELERQSIGQEIHDGLGQELTGMAFLVEVLEQKMTERGYPEAAEVHRIADLMGKSIDHARLISRTMFPVRLEREGIAPVLRDLADMTGSIFKIECTCVVDESLSTMPPSKANQFYHITQEAVNNAIKHGQPNEIRISLVESGDNIVLEVWNDGKPSDDIGPLRFGIGFNIMRYRAKILNGEFKATNTRGGFLVSLRVPKTVPGVMEFVT